VLFPVPVVFIPPGVLVTVHEPVVGNPSNSTLPDGVEHDGCVMTPITGGKGFWLTARVNMAEAAAHGSPKGLFVVIVMITVLPTSPATGVYVNEKGVVPEVEGAIAPKPFSVIVTFVALPPNVFPLTVIGAVPQVMPLFLVNVTVGEPTHPHATRKLAPVVVHPAEFLTVIEWVPSGTLKKEVPL
jgi:hypothetical protein